MEVDDCSTVDGEEGYL